MINPGGQDCRPEPENGLDLHLRERPILTRRGESSVRDERVDVRVSVNELAEGLNRRDHARKRK